MKYARIDVVLCAYVSVSVLLSLYVSVCLSVCDWEHVNLPWKSESQLRLAGQSVGRQVISLVAEWKIRRVVISDNFQCDFSTWLPHSAQWYFCCSRTDASVFMAPRSPLPFVPYLHNLMGYISRSSFSTMGHSLDALYCILTVFQNSGRTDR